MKQVGTVLPEVLKSLKTDSSPPSTAPLSAITAESRKMTLAEAKKIISSPLPPLEECSEKHFNQCFRILAASLPKRSSDQPSGELMLAAYRRTLGGYSKDAINYLSDRVLSRCEWFPTIKECLDILGGFERSDGAVRAFNEAEAVVWWDRQRRFDDAMHRLACGECTQEQIDVLPESWKKVGETRSYLWLLPDGSYIARIKQGGERVPFPEQF